MAESGSEEKEPEGDGERRVRELVDELYTFRDLYFETHGMEEAGNRQRDLEERMQATLKALREFEGCPQRKAHLLVLEGRALNVMPEYSPRAEQLLSRAVKLEPGMIEAWNQLGEVYWKKGDLSAAHTCFTGALNQCKNKVSLRNLSIVLRHLPAQEEDGTKNVLASVEQAKVAVQMDVTDGTSWYILGNAYLSLFFLTGQSERVSQQALGAYAQAEKVDTASRNNPDLQLNRSTLHRYEERYQTALEGFARAAALDPASPEASHRHQQLLSFLDRVSTMVQQKGKLKTKRLNAMVSSLVNRELPQHQGRSYSSPSGQPLSLSLRPLSALRPGPNPGLVVLGKVVFSLTTDDKVPFTFGLLDGEGTCVAVMVYNIAESWAVLIGDTVAIPQPLFKEHRLEHRGKKFAFNSVRVETPLVLMVNGRKQSASCQAAAIVAYRDPAASEERFT
ncbi:tetratricopeptide repeat protein 5 [Hemitrygon akajei]|uniref:tetratricopeptide repeat protein 5 n=1 Tax=Hemitrygon akajei TaxID=2704970 RepID=UPI003BF9A36B